MTVAGSHTGYVTGQDWLVHPRVAVVHDYLTQPGGAERVVLAMLRAFPGAPVATSVYEPDGTFPEFRDHEVLTSALQRLGPIRKDPRLALPFLAAAFSRISLPEVDAVMVSSSGWAHGVPTEVPKIVYCHTPPRWLYQREDYLKGQPGYVRFGLAGLAPWLRRWDHRAAASASRYLANSRVVAERVRRTYGIDVEILHPPVLVDAGGEQTPLPDIDPGYLLTVSRGRGYKNVDVVAAAVRELLPAERLVIVGDVAVASGRDHRVKSVGRVSDGQLRWLYANARALVSVSREDFGLTPLEANAFGTPAVLLRAGGFLDSLVEGVNGVFVADESPVAVAAAVSRLDPAGLDPDKIKAHAGRFSEDAFVARLRAVVTEVLS